MFDWTKLYILPEEFKESLHFKSFKSLAFPLHFYSRFDPFIVCVCVWTLLSPTGWCCLFQARPLPEAWESEGSVQDLSCSQYCALMDRDLRCWSTQLGGYSPQCPNNYWHHCCLHTSHLFWLFFPPLVFLKLLVCLLSNVAISQEATSTTTAVFWCLSTTTMSGWLVITSLSVWIRKSHRILAQLFPRPILVVSASLTLGPPVHTWCKCFCFLVVHDICWWYMTYRGMVFNNSPSGSSFMQSLCYLRSSVGAIFFMYSWILGVLSWIVALLLTSHWPRLLSRSAQSQDAGLGVKPCMLCKEFPCLDISGLHLFQWLGYYAREVSDYSHGIGIDSLDLVFPIQLTLQDLPQVGIWIWLTSVLPPLSWTSAMSPSCSSTSLVVIIFLLLDTIRPHSSSPIDILMLLL